MEILLCCRVRRPNHHYLMMIWQLMTGTCVKLMILPMNNVISLGVVVSMQPSLRGVSPPEMPY
jgi:hypothetical protein